jgi:hypothetical protein
MIEASKSCALEVCDLRAETKARDEDDMTIISVNFATGRARSAD